MKVRHVKQFYIITENFYIYHKDAADWVDWGPDSIFQPNTFSVEHVEVVSMFNNLSTHRLDRYPFPVSILATKTHIAHSCVLCH